MQNGVIVDFDDGGNVVKGRRTNNNFIKSDFGSVHLRWNLGENAFDGDNRLRQVGFAETLAQVDLDGARIRR